MQPSHSLTCVVVWDRSPDGGEKCGRGIRPLFHIVHSMGHGGSMGNDDVSSFAGGTKKSFLALWSGDGFGSSFSE